jgi:hypothetical protein
MIDTIIEDGVIDEIDRYAAKIKSSSSHLISDTSASVSEI